MTELASLGTLRLMEKADVSAVAAIEALVQGVPWGESLFASCFGEQYHNYVLVEEGRVIGFFLLSFAAEEAHIMNIAIHPGHQGQGIGRKLLANLMEKCRGLNARSVFLEVRVSNQPAISLYESEGFNCLGVRRDYYDGPVGREDGAIYGLELFYS